MEKIVITFLLGFFLFSSLKGEDSPGRENLTDSQVQELEKNLESNPKDINSRNRILKYYLTKAFESPTIRKTRQKHALWIIKNAPESELAGTPFVSLDPLLDGADVYQEAKKIWLGYVETSKSTTVIMNASHFFVIYFHDDAEKILKKGKEIDPNNPEWSFSLGFLYSLDAHYPRGKNKDEMAKKSFKEYEEGYGKDISEQKKLNILDSLATSAFEAGKTEKAREYAEEFIELSSKYPKDRNYGDYIHKSNLILGRVALQSGDIRSAKKFLIKAAEVPGSSKLETSGPNMMLAKELLEKGERSVVLEYFKLCRKFWKKSSDKLDDWTDRVKRKKMPDFRANLYY